MSKTVVVVIPLLLLVIIHPKYNLTMIKQISLPKVLRVCSAIALIVCLLSLIGLKIITPFLTFSFFITLSFTLLFISWYIEEYKYEPQSRTQSEKRKKHLNALRDAILVCVVLLIIIIGHEMNFITFI